MSRILSGLGRLLSARRGSVAVEFALLTPLMITLFFGAFEGFQLIRANMKASVAAQELADLVGQQTAMTSSNMANFCTGARLAMAPYDGSKLKAVVSSVVGPTPSVAWQSTNCGSPSALSGSAILNAVSAAGISLPTSSDSVIFVQVSYAYSAPTSIILGGAFQLTQSVFAKPRGNAPITCTGC
jgi:Flp pilus assembly protein TadG